MLHSIRMAYQRKSKNLRELRELRAAAARKRWDALTPAQRSAQQDTRAATAASPRTKPRKEAA